MTGSEAGRTARSERLAALRSRLASGDPAAPAGAEGTSEGTGEATAAQLRLWLVHETDPTGAALNVALAARVGAGVPVARFRAALDAVVARHPALRTRVQATDDGDLRATADLPAHCPVTVAGAEEDLVAAGERAVRTPIDVAAEHPLRVVVQERDGEVTGFVLAVHHLAWDDGCWQPFFDDLAAAYEGRALAPGPDPAVVAARIAPSGTERDRQRAYWREALRDARMRALPGAVDGAPPGPNAAHEIALPEPVGTGLAEAAARLRASPFAVLLTAFRAALRSTPGPLVVAVPVLRRDQQAARDCVAYLGNTLAFPCRLPADATGREAVRAVADDLLGALAHADLDFAEQIRMAGRTGAGGGVEVGATVESTDVTLSLGGVPAEFLPVRSGISHFPLMLIARDDGDARWTLRFEHLAELVDARTVAGLAEATVSYVDAIVSDPDAVLVATARRRDAAPSDRPTAVDLIAAQVARVPDAPAVTAGGRTRTHAELWASAGAVAAALRARGVGTESVVATVLRRSPDAVAATLGVLRSGAAVTEVNPDLPTARVGRLLASAGAALVLTDRAVRDEHAAVIGDDHLVVDALTGAAEGDLPAPHPDAIACVIHTSGSTGTPKPVALSHAALGDHLRWFLPTHFDSGTPRWLQTSAPGFDIALGEVLCTLAAGGEVIVAPPGVERDPDAFVDAIEDSDANIVHAVPTLLEHVLRSAQDKALPELGMLSWIPVGGEPFPGGLADRFTAAFGGIGLSNFYGPTETTICVTGTRIHGRQGDRTVGLGGPKTGTDLHVLDERLEPVPDGAVGELYVRGDSVARGYHGRPAATAERFVPAAGGTRRYRTGDLVRRSRSGIEFVGRVDDQVKIRGIRVEPGEIEAALRERPEVRQAAVVIAGDEIAGYVTLQGGGTDPDAGERIRRGVAETLPGALVPAHVTVLDAFPATAHGKIDRSALPAPLRPAAPEGPDEPEDQRAVTAIFTDVLGRDDVTARDSFFALGGHSLLIMKVVAAVRDRLGVRISVRDLFDAPTPAGLAARIAGSSAVPEEPVAPDVPATRPEHPPLTAAQRRIWVIDQMSGPSATYDVPLAVELTGPLDADRLAGAVADLCDRHEVLRTRYPERDGVGWQDVTAGPPVVERLDVTPDRLDETVARLGSVVFDLTRDVPVRVTLLRVGAEHHVLVLVVHHIACDDRTARILVDELAELYAARVDGSASPASPEAQLVDLALAERAVAELPSTVERRARQAAFWRDALADPPAVTAVSADRSRPAEPTDDGGLVTFRLDRELRGGVERLAAATDSTAFLVLQTALATLLAGRGAGPDVLLGTPCSTRPPGDRTPGLFVNMIVLRTDLSGAPTFRTALGRAREFAAGAYEHADLSFERILDAAGVDRSGTAHPLFGQIVQLREEPAGTVVRGGASWAVRPQVGATAKYDLAWDLEPDPDGGYRGEVVFRRDLYDERTVTGLAESLCAVVTAAVADPDAPLAEAIDAAADGSGVDSGAGAEAPWVDDVSGVDTDAIAEALRELSEVDDVVVVAVDGGRARGLVAYVTPSDPSTPDPAEVEAAVRRAAAQRLPAQLVPGAVAVLDELPRTASGDVDTADLPPPAKITTGTFDPPGTDAERALAELFGSVLGVDNVGRGDSFFALGGDSIMSIQIASRARGRGYPISAQLVFRNPTVEALAVAAVEAADSGAELVTAPSAPMSASGLDADTLLALLGETPDARSGR
ncbi:non-ribosomal peptide synthetase [Pseudonocardia endophytica]|uniref:non-ribosomal peptide synthetase n=1 Tax=Pseudonocardia endophytica TaxID=401976 RepID=UPI001050D217|nr:non-ribosomal peptide synthetase [Pseudonocardia endophytica]